MLTAANVAMRQSGGEPSVRSNGWGWGVGVVPEGRAEAAAHMAGVKSESAHLS